jgi:hypothetical protein
MSVFLTLFHSLIHENSMDKLFELRKQDSETKSDLSAIPSQSQYFILQGETPLFDA